ncbi:hypothetical protein [Halococcus thailandensis]|uniref:Uncharacterized protein n=1 Tax=Halococcus thailandensis JCM 13552 TaxID=1227457 RepID=M0MWZ2_9EURY|nr:hypothetical protein [Halococcus thailandensis]EMA50257.1 hypothetical protein C451_17200 [Halococcus thailandensis JCM 13552]
MYPVQAVTTTACRRGDGDTVSDQPRESIDDSDDDRTPSMAVVRAISRLPGIRERAPRRNALVMFTYLLLAASLAGLFGWIIDNVPLAL